MIYWWIDPKAALRDNKRLRPHQAGSFLSTLVFFFYTVNKSPHNIFAVLTHNWKQEMNNS